MNLAFDGSIHPEIHEMEVFADHRENYEFSRERWYQHAHPVEFTEGGVLHAIFGATEVMVNSLHGQGIDRLGTGLSVEAVAADGLIETTSVEHADCFALGVQRHPEWRFWEDDLSRKIFDAFHNAIMERFETD